MAEKKVQVRKYPPLYEKAIPVLLTILAIVIAGMLVVTIGVALGLVGGAA